MMDSLNSDLCKISSLILLHFAEEYSIFIPEPFSIALSLNSPLTELCEG